MMTYVATPRAMEETKGADLMSSTMLESALFSRSFAEPEMLHIFSDEVFVENLLRVEVALAQAEAELGMIPTEAAEAIDQNARVENFSMSRLGEQIAATGHVLVPLVRELSALCGPEAGGYVHWGATTQDVIDTAHALQWQAAFNVIEQRLNDIVQACARLAQTEADTIMPGRTHGQHALPVTFGYKAAVWCWELYRQHERWRQAKPRVLVGNLTGAVGTLASFAGQGDLVQDRAMDKLGLGVPEICWHASRDRPAEVAALLTLTAGTVEKIATEIYRLQSTEYGELEEPFHAGKVGSSTMPHKRNPTLCEAVMTCCKATRAEASMVFEAMLQEHERQSALWRTEWVGLSHGFILLGNALAKLSLVVQGLKVDANRMRRNLDLSHGSMMSERVMLVLGRKVGRDRAHELVYEASMTAYETGRDLQDVLREAAAFRHISSEEWQTLFDYRSYVGDAAEIARRTASALLSDTVPRQPKGNGKPSRGQGEKGDGSYVVDR